MRTKPKPFFNYWGKALREGEEHHLLVFHSLDVAAVANQWLKQSVGLQTKIRSMWQCDLRVFWAWILFFIALHDYGKAATPFQLKKPNIYRDILGVNCSSREGSAKKFYHDMEGYSYFRSDFARIFEDNGRAELWDLWIRSVAGHHGSLSEPQREAGYVLGYSTKDKQRDQIARRAWVDKVEELFLKPQGIAIDSDKPPFIDPIFLAGFCSVCDWLGSDETFFEYQSVPMDLRDYWKNTQTKAAASLASSGIISSPTKNTAFATLFPGFEPNQFQKYVQLLPARPGLFVFEAPTGLGKTEAALQLAATMIGAGLAESIIFALPSQATANAMYERITKFAKNAFKGEINIVLAHSKAKTNSLFKAYSSVDKKEPAQDDDARIQCNSWITSSRKKVFLGQIGVSTIDQVLLSVLPVRHSYVRTLGLARSVLIVDEVHSSDPHMIGLLKAVLHQQRRTDSTTILLSATLPTETKKSLLQPWNKDADTTTIDPRDTYPIVSYIHDKTIHKSPKIAVEDSHKKTVKLELQYHESMLLSEELKETIIERAQSGEHIAIICNLVDDAISVFDSLKEKLGCATNTVSLDLFHSRFTVKDRHRIESTAMGHFGRNKLCSKVKTGRILVATQVIEQSLDIDFDFMVTQICPIDSLVQRMGRLQRFAAEHSDTMRPEPKCVVVTTESYDYLNHLYIYKCRGHLWRTQKLLESHSEFEFPSQYRFLVDSVYQKKPWADEPADITKSFIEFETICVATEDNARRLTRADITKTQDHAANEEKLRIMTRDGEMSLVIVLVVDTCSGLALMDGSLLSGVPNSELQETLEYSAIRVPASWRAILNEANRYTDVATRIKERCGDIAWLIAGEVSEDGTWIAHVAGKSLRYCETSGLVRL